jgi:hypothetical protein
MGMTVKLSNKGYTKGVAFCVSLMSNDTHHMARSSSVRLYRILCFSRAVQILERGEPHFVHPSTWVDAYEVRLRHAASDQFFGQCWCMKGVPDALWRIYSPNHLGPCIATSTKPLSQALLPAFRELGATIRRDKFDYLNQFNIDMQLPEIQADLSYGFSVKRATDALLLKMRAFYHEGKCPAVWRLAPLWKKA